MNCDIKDNSGYYKTIIFNHIPKTAGLTLNSIMERQYSKNQIFSTLGWEGGRKQAFDAFLNYSINKKLEFNLITGHSALRLFNYVKSPVVLIMFRHPVDRVISLYSYVRRNAGHKFYKITNKYSLLECYENKIYQEWEELSNGQTSSLISSINQIDINELKSYTDDLDKIKTFLNLFCIIGIVEKFDESLHIFKTRLNWKKHIYYHKVNVSTIKPDLSSDVIDLILSNNRKDYEIYKYALCQFDECIEDMGINFKKGVNSFKIVNKYLMHLLTIKSQFNYYFKKIYNYN